MQAWAFPIGIIGLLTVTSASVAIVVRLAGGNRWGWRVLIWGEAVGVLLIVPAVVTFTSTFSGCNAVAC